jgi:uncharacterized protein
MRPEGSPSGHYLGRAAHIILTSGKRIHHMKVRDSKMGRFKIITCVCFLFLSMTITTAWGFDGMDIVQVRKLAEEGNADAQSKLGVLYASGVGMNMDKREAVRWYLKSAEQGYPVGQWNLAFMYVRGEGVETNFAEARRLFRKSAESGFANAQYDLGMMLLQGLGGKQDRSEAEKWFHMAAEQGYREAKTILKELDPK